MNLSGSPVDYLLAFFGGVLVSFTPCVYPLIPVSLTYIGARGAGSKLKGFFLSLVYVSGIAVTYSLLGLFASLTGKIFGTISAHPLVNIGVGVVIIFFGLSMFDWFHLPALHLVKVPKFSKKNYFSVFFLGLVSGLIIGPCTTSVLGAILVYLAAKKNLIYGASLLFSFAFGMGLVLILTGTFSSLIVNLPKSGKWLSYIKKAGGVVLMGLGIYFIYNGIRSF